jgi:hypothetical protein
MVDRTPPLSLWWVLGSFHSTLLVALLVWLIYPGGGLGVPLSGLNTLTGIAIYLALWATTLFTARRALTDLDWLSDRPKEMGSFYWRAMRWGAVNGLLFLLTISVTQFLTVAASSSPGATLQSALFTALLIGSFGLPFAAVIGGVIGVTLGAVDIAALRIARSLTRSGAEG